MSGFADFDTGHRDLVTVTKFNFYGNRIMTASSDHRMKVWDQKDGEWQLIDTWRAHDAEIRDATWNGPFTGQHIGSVGEDMKCKIWQEDVTQPPNSGRRFRPIFRMTAPQRHPFVSLDFRNIDLESWLAVITRDGYLMVMEPVSPDTLADWQPLDQFRVCTAPQRGEETSFKVQFHHDPTDITHSVLPSSDRKSLSLVVAAMDTVKIYRTDANRRFYHAIELTGHGGLVRDISWANGSVRGYDLIASGCKDGFVRVFEVYTTVVSHNKNGPHHSKNNLHAENLAQSPSVRATSQSGIGSALANRVPASITSRPTMGDSPFKHSFKEVACVDSKHLDVWQVEFSYAGTGLFVGSGQALAAGGPLSLLLSYGFISVLVYCFGTALAEVAAHVPISGGTMVNHNYRYSSSHLAFSISYLRWYSLAILVPFEITNAIVNLGLFVPESRVAMRVSIMAVVIVCFNLLPEKPFKGTETMFALVKLATTIGLMGLTIFLGVRGVPTGARGFHYWNDPGFMNEYLVSGHMGRFLGLVQCLLYSMVSFTLVPELIVQRAEGLDATMRPSVVRVAQLDSVQLSVLYLLSVVAIGVVCPFDHPSLTNEGGAGLSPVLIGVQISQIPVLPIVVTLAIFLSSMASGRSFLFLSSRTLCSLSEAGHAPQVFQYRNRFGVPYVSVLASGLFSLFAYLSVATSSSAVFNWLMHFVTTSGYISWLGSSLVYLHFRRTTAAQGFTRAHQTRIQPYGAYFGILSCSVLSFANGLITAPGQGFPGHLVSGYLGIASFALLYFGHRLNSMMRGKSKSGDEQQPKDQSVRRMFCWQRKRPERVSHSA